MPAASDGVSLPQQIAHSFSTAMRRCLPARALLQHRPRHPIDANGSAAGRGSCGPCPQILCNRSSPWHVF